mmetsp:Transcript_74230/g.215062  ORF Transcript_74230/g.215062 Transcript_74230/m.215062 type:complete len:209 (+) Transcript_74230:98-724(+)
MHQSRWAISSSCWRESSVTILSISSFTLVNASSCALAASKDNCGAPVSAAARSSADTTRRRRSFCAEVASAETWRKATFTVFSKLSKDVSSFRMAIVSSTAAISVVRSLTRCANSSSLTAHFSFKFARKVRSSSSWACVSSNSLKACACFSFNAAISWSSSDTILRPAAISSCFAAFSNLNSSTAFFSLACASERSFSKSSFICSSTP